MHADLWGWFNRYVASAAISGNPLKLRMPQVYDQGWEALRAEEGQRALALFQEGLEIARKLQEPCWELFFEYWCAETHIFYLTDYVTGLDRAVKVAAKAHKTAYLPCPVRARVYYTLLYVYFLMDAVGYEDKIREMVDFMTKEIPLDADTEQRIQYIRAGLAFSLEQYDVCEQETQRYLNMTLFNAHRQSGGYNMLRRLAYARGQIKLAFDYAYEYERRARQARLQNSVAHALLSQAAYAQRLGQAERAQRLMEQGTAHHAQYGLQRMTSYYNHLCEYYELGGEMDTALALRDEQVANLHTIQSHDYVAYTWLQVVRLQARAGRDFTDALQSAYEAARNLLKPQSYLEKIQRIEAGDYYEYDWQKPASQP